MEDMDEGKLYYDWETKRYVFYPKDGGRETPLHCGYTMDVYDNGKWIPTRIEMGQDWYLVGTDFRGADLEGLKVRF